MKDRSN